MSCIDVVPLYPLRDTLAYYSGFKFGLYSAKSFLTNEEKAMFFFFGLGFALFIDFCFFVWRKLK